MQPSFGYLQCPLWIATKDRQSHKANQKRLQFLGDSWFGSMLTAENLKLLCLLEDGEFNAANSWEGYVIGTSSDSNYRGGHEGIFAVKTNHGWFPKKELETNMKDWPSGSYLVMETTAPDSGIELIAIGYKYNAHKVLCFVATKQAGSTTPGQPYKAKFPDRFGNV